MAKARSSGMTVKSKVEVPELIEMRRGQIITAAIELFGKHGYHVTTIRDIAKRADVSIGLIYQYVSDKEDVLFLALLEVLDSYQRAIPAAISGLEEPLERFCAAVRAYCKVNDDKGDATVLAYRETKSLRKQRRDLIMEKEIEIERADRGLHQATASPPGCSRKSTSSCSPIRSSCSRHAWALKAWRFRRRMTSINMSSAGLKLMLGPVLTTQGAHAVGRIEP